MASSHPQIHRNTHRNARRATGRLISAGNELARTAEKTGEMALASAQTIGYRTAMMLQASGDPVAMANPEFTLMGQEKVEAAIESGQALAVGAQDVAEAWANIATSQVRGAFRAWTALLQCRTPAEVLVAQQRYWQESLSGFAAAAAKLTHAASCLAGAGLAPVHRVASANARRLARQHR